MKVLPTSGDYSFYTPDIFVHALSCCVCDFSRYNRECNKKTKHAVKKK